MQTTQIAPPCPAPCEQLNEELIFSYFNPRDPQGHKGTFGTLLMVCGSYGMIGAAVMAAKAALRCGVGLLNIAVRKECYPLMAGLVPEAVFTILDDATPQAAAQSEALLLHAMQKATACVTGCGLGRDAAWHLPAVLAACAQTQCPAVLDADALNYLANHLDLLDGVGSPLIVTPHPAEMARLAHSTTAAVQQARFATATKFAATHQVYTVLKGAGTLIATPSGSVTQNPTGNAGMGKGGSGDVLAGMVGSILAQGFAPEHAAQTAVYIHGAVGDACAEALSQTAMQPTDMIEYLPRYFKEMAARYETVS